MSLLVKLFHNIENKGTFPIFLNQATVILILTTHKLNEERALQNNFSYNLELNIYIWRCKRSQLSTCQKIPRTHQNTYLSLSGRAHPTLAGMLKNICKSIHVIYPTNKMKARNDTIIFPLISEKPFDDNKQHFMDKSSRVIKNRRDIIDIIEEAQSQCKFRRREIQSNSIKKKKKARLSILSHLLNIVNIVLWVLAS